MPLEELPLRQLDAALIFPFTYTGKIEMSSPGSRLYNDSGKDRIIQKIRASLGTASEGAAVIVDVRKDEVSVFSTDTPIANPTPTQHPRLFIPASAHTTVGTPMDGVVWAVGEYLSVSIDQTGTTFPGEDLTINVVVAE